MTRVPTVRIPPLRTPLLLTGVTIPPLDSPSPEAVRRHAHLTGMDGYAAAADLELMRGRLFRGLSEDLARVGRVYRELIEAFTKALVPVAQALTKALAGFAAKYAIVDELHYARHHPPKLCIDGRALHRRHRARRRRGSRR